MNKFINNRLRYLILVSITVLACAKSFALDYDIIICDKESNTTRIAVEENLIMRVTGSDLIISSKDDSKQFSIDNIYSLKYEERNTDGITSIEHTTFSENVIKFSENALYIQASSTSNSYYQIFDTNGVKIAEKGFYQSITIPLASFTTGIYLVQVNGQKPIKIVVK